MESVLGSPSCAKLPSIGLQLEMEFAQIKTRDTQV